MPFISDETVLAVKRGVEIYDVISGYFPLKKAGANYKACCPFHDEKTPSFNVHPEKQIYKCFGCGVAGDAIKFVMTYEKVEFADAIRILAEKAGIPITYQDGGPSGPSKEDVTRVNEWAADFFRKQLETPEAAPAREFLARRGVSPETSASWRLGYSPASWDGLIKAARGAGYDEKLLLLAGLVIQRENRPGGYDRFRGRVMFPIFDPRGKVIAFGARTLGDEQPKFINSSETAAFSKGRTLFGLHLAKDDVDVTRTLYIVEGYLDVILPYQAGVKGMVATLGTSLTRDHLKVLRRYADKIVLVFDSDAAGQKASERGLDLLLAEDMDLFVAKLPPGQDPDDVVMKGGAEALNALLSAPQEMFEFLVESLCAKIDISTPNGKAKVVEELLSRIAQVPNEIKREVLLQRIAQRFSMPEQVLRGRLQRAPSTPLGAGAPVAPPPVPVIETASEHKVAKELIALLLYAPLRAEVRRQVPADRFPTEASRAIAAKAYAWIDKGLELTGSDLTALMQEPALMQMVAEAANAEIDSKDAPRRLAQDLDFLASREFAGRVKESRAGMKTAQGDEDVNRRLRELTEARKNNPNDPRLLPGR